ncbi:hypothetical protein HMPREF2651_08820 [Corynebacterium sp. HMSC063A05]|uniref:hypothetical protein n=1 Tax=unclassified Corynebacterium TaxID=2624378 RepID=UPI00066744C0|nr:MULTISPECIES: hypothetical protein [unclassified Corynebacterium]OFM83501.1 hypothetical protein HMPREF2651_08820 [Corynebacterium sp. HMSC063A05]
MADSKEALYRTDKRLQAENEKAVDEFGVPTDAESAYRLTKVLHPIIPTYPDEYYEHEISAMGQSVAESGLENAPATQRK